MVDRHDNQDITERAAAWIARLDSHELSADELIELRDWATASPAHLRELERLADVWESLDPLIALRAIIAKPKPARRRTLQTLAVAASIGVVAFAITLWTMSFDLADPIEIEAAYATDVGEQRAIEPGEGSTINLNTDSRVSIVYSASERLVKLTHGEAFFDVASDDERPFVVETELGNVIVTGTAFLVRLDASGMEVVVEEGSVQLQHRLDRIEEAPATVTELIAGEIATVEPGGNRSIELIEPGLMVRRLGWRDGMLMFDGESLEEVIEEVGRYTPIEIVIDDASLRDRRIGGYFRVGEMEDLLATLAEDFDIRVDRISDNEIRLAAGQD